jgi:hypothetical protein
MQKIEDMNQNLSKAMEEVGKVNAYDPKQHLAIQLLKEIFKSKVDPKFIRIITCIKKSASKVKEDIVKLKT